MHYRIDENGFLAGSFTEDYPYFQEDWVLVSTEITESFIKPKWNGSKWVEGTTPEEIDIKKQIEIEKLKEMQFQELSETDWYVVRKIDIGTPIPEEILQQRQQIRDKYNELNNK